MIKLSRLQKAIDWLKSKDANEVNISNEVSISDNISDGIIIWNADLGIEVKIPENIEIDMLASAKNIVETNLDEEVDHHTV